MSGVTKDTIQKILLLALAAMTVSMVFISIFNYNDNIEKNDYLDNEKILVREELMDIIKNYDHLGKLQVVDHSILKSERRKAKELLRKIEQSDLDYESIIKYRKQLLTLRKTNRQLHRKFDGSL
ncbi:hypothetical protein [Kordia jejudonensis]|uniref:hypothetical protein n=1 Tax=Kordia jejudonensis TaxID=1348245 RepID=UPI0006291B40|nr:hypothetical protein [Kordia jejudonensis]